MEVKSSVFAALIWYWSRIVLNAAARSSRVGCFLDFVAVFITPPWEALIRGRMMQLPSAGKCHFSSPTMKRNISKYKRKRPEATPAYITVAIETGIATVGRRSGTINTRDAVGAKKQAELVEPGPKTVESLTYLSLSLRSGDEARADVPAAKETHELALVVDAIDRGLANALGIVD